MVKYFEKKRGIFWGVVSIILFFFAFGGYDIIFKLTNNLYKDISDIKNIILLMLAFSFLIVIFLAILIAKTASAKKSEPKIQPQKTQ